MLFSPLNEINRVAKLSSHFILFFNLPPVL